MAAGVAVIGAGLFAAVPAMQHPLTVQQHDVQLVNSGDLGEVLGSAAANFAERQADIAAGDLTPTLAGLTTEYTDRITDILDRSSDALQAALTQFPDVLQEAAELYAGGNALDAFDNLNQFFLRQGLGAGGRPFFDLLARPDDPLRSGVLEDLSEDYTAAFQQLFSVDTARGAALATFGPFVTAGYRAALENDIYTDQLEAGDTAAALNTLFQAPTRVLDAFLNGDDFLGTTIEQDEPFPGFLTADGPLDFFFRTLPDSIAEALGGPPAEETAAAVAEVSVFEDVSSVLDLSSSFDAASWLDPSTWFDASTWFEDLVTAFDPADIIAAATAELAI